MIDLRLQQLLAEVIASPDADKPRQDYAEHLRSIGLIDRARFIDLQLDMARLVGENPENYFDTLALRAEEENLSKKLSDKIDKIMGLPEEMINAHGQDMIDAFGYFRGFVELVELSVPKLIAYGDEIIARAPVQHVNIAGYNIHDNSMIKNFSDQQLFSLPCLKGIRSLDLELTLDDKGVEELTNSNYLQELRWLSLANCKITKRSAEALARSEKLPKLRYVNFRYTGLNLNELFQLDGSEVYGRYMPWEADNFEAELGKTLLWLRHPGNPLSLAYVAVDRFQLCWDYDKRSKT